MKRMERLCEGEQEAQKPNECKVQKAVARKEESEEFEECESLYTDTSVYKEPCLDALLGVVAWYRKVPTHTIEYQPSHFNAMHRPEAD